MKRILFSLALICSAAGAAPLTDLSGGQTGRIEFQSTSPESRFALIRNDKAHARDVVVWGDLYMPKNVSGKVSAVVFSHGSEGMVNSGHNTYTEVWVRALNDAGIAAFLVDSFTPRTVDNVNGAKILTQNIAVNISDSLHALKLLSTHPKIDDKRIFNMGWSLGGTVAADSAFPAMYKYILPAGTQWAGSVALYGGCNMKWRSDHLGTNPGPLLMLLGEIDDNTPSQACVDHARSLAREGHKVTYKVYFGAGHDFDRLEERPRQIQHGVFGKCDIEIKMSLQAGGPGAGYDFVQKKAFSTWHDLNSATSACAKMGTVTIAGQRQAREQAVKDVLEFIRAN